MTEFLRGKLTYTALVAMAINMIFGDQIFSEEEVRRIADAVLLLIALFGRIRATIRENSLRYQLMLHKLPLAE